MQSSKSPLSSIGFLPSSVLSPRAIPSNFILRATFTTDAMDDKVDIASNVALVKQRMDDAIASNDLPAGSVRLVAVSKTKPLELLVAAYEVSFHWG